MEYNLCIKEEVINQMKEIFTVLSTIYKATESNGSMPSFQADVYSTIRNELYVVYKTD